MNINQRDIEKKLRRLGITGAYKGFDYLTYGIMIAMQDKTLLTHVYKGLYVDIAFHFGITVASVERNIRTVKCAILKRANKKLLFEIFGDIEYIPVNADFLDTMVDYFRYSYDES